MYILLGSIGQISKAVTLKSYHLFELPGKRLKRATQDLRARSCISCILRMLCIFMF